MRPPSDDEGAGTHRSRRALLDALIHDRLSRNAARPTTIPPRAPQQPIPLSRHQVPLWHFFMKSSGAPIDTEFVVIAMDERIDRAALQRSFDDVRARHEILRTGIAVVDGQPSQLISPPSPFDLVERDLRNLPEAERDTKTSRVLPLSFHRAMRAQPEEMLRASLFQLQDDRYELHLAIRHLIADCLTIYNLLIPELAAVYTAFAGGESHGLLRPELHYGDYSVWQSSALPATTAAAGPAATRTYPHSVCQILTDCPRAARKSFQGAVDTLMLDTSLIDPLENIVRREGATLFMGLSALLVNALRGRLNASEVIVATETAARQRPELQRMMGFFLDPLLLRIDVAGDPTFCQLLGRVRRATTEAMSAGPLPVDYLIRNLHPTSSEVHDPPFQLMIRLGPEPGPLGRPWSIRTTAADPAAAKFDLTADFYKTKGGVTVRLEYDTSLFRQETICDLLTACRTTLVHAIAESHRAHT